MKHIVEKNWVTGSDKNIDFYELLNLSREYILKGSKLFIGSDSFISKQKICFATALCLHGGEKGGRYFFFKDFQLLDQKDFVLGQINDDYEVYSFSTCSFVFQR